VFRERFSNNFKITPRKKVARSTYNSTQQPSPTNTRLPRESVSSYFCDVAARANPYRTINSVRVLSYCVDTK